MTIRKWTIVAAIAVGAIALLVRPARADRPQSLVYGVYDSEYGALNAYKALEQAQRDQVVRMQALGGPATAAVGATAGGATGFAAGEATGIPTQDIQQQQQQQQQPQK